MSNPGVTWLMHISVLITCIVFCVSHRSQQTVQRLQCDNLFILSRDAHKSFCKTSLKSLSSSRSPVQTAPDEQFTLLSRWPVRVCLQVLDKVWCGPASFIFLPQALHFAIHLFYALWVVLIGEAYDKWKSSSCCCARHHSVVICGCVSVIMTCWCAKTWKKYRLFASSKSSVRVGVKFFEGWVSSQVWSHWVCDLGATRVQVANVNVNVHFPLKIGLHCTTLASQR